MTGRVIARVTNTFPGISIEWSKNSALRHTTALLGLALVLAIALALLPHATLAASSRDRSSRASRVPDAPVTIELDATGAPMQRLHARLVFPVKPGPVTLVYPKWIPGEHSPTGPLADLAGLTFSAGGAKLVWTRDPEDMYAIRCEVPGGARSLEVQLDFLLPPTSEGFSSAASATSQLAVLSWNHVVLYPKGASPDAIHYAPRLRLPEGWKYATALETVRTSGGSIEFAPVSLTTLIDSPVQCGTHMRSIELTGSATGPVFLHLAADSEAALDLSAARKAAFTKLAAEANALFGARHYRSYHFLLSLSDRIAHFGLEHHESSDDRTDERSLVDDDRFEVFAGLLPHEVTHSWNGKYRRPEGLATPDYQKPMKGDLLWVYEGLTQYLGNILTARSGLRTPDQFRDLLAADTGRLDIQSGRTWRPLSDTAVEAQILYESRRDWRDWRRHTDFYDEGMLIWLEADVTIRRLTAGRKSLDDFCRAFQGAPGGPPIVKPYTFDDVVAALNGVAPFEWKGLLQARLSSIAPHAPMGGITGSGWRLAWTEILPPHLKSWESVREKVNLSWSLGVILDKEGAVEDVVKGFPAEKAGIGPGMKIIAINGRKYDKTRIREAIRESRSSKEPLELLVENGDYYRTYRVNYHGGERYPRLERDSSHPDVLSEIIAPRTKP